MHDTVIRGGTIVDGTGGEPFTGDVAIDGGCITEVGVVDDEARETLDADGLLVTPGFVDVHTHYDGQATWDAELAPSCWHGVTSVVMGNCGVGFAPVRPGCEDALIAQMEGVEDIPGTALATGIEWCWESFPEYLDFLAERRFMLDVGTQVPHAALRAYVMGERATDPEPTPAELAAMAALVREGLHAGALGVSTSRILAHRTSGGVEVPGTYASEAELEAIARPLGALGTGVFEVVPRGMDGEVSEAAHAEIAWMGRLARELGRPVVFSLVQTHSEIDRFHELLEAAETLRQEGVPLFPQVANRPTGILAGLQSDHHTFSTRPSYQAVAALPLAERVKRMRDPELRSKILGEAPGEWDHPLAAMVHLGFGNLLPLGATFELEPCAEDTVEKRAAREGRSPEEVVYDLFLESDGRSFLLFPFTNYFRFSLDDVYDMLNHPASMWGLGDGGAHCGVACDAGGPTLMLTHWVRDRSRGPRIPLARAVQWMTQDTAQVYGLHDRGLLAPGYRADLNLINHEHLQIELPEMVFDLPGGERRMMQRARGYVATFVAGERTIENDRATGRRPGRLIRGEQPTPD